MFYTTLTIGGISCQTLPLKPVDYTVNPTTYRAVLTVNPTTYRAILTVNPTTYDRCSLVIPMARDAPKNRKDL